jgi:hypothetical protein
MDKNQKNVAMNEITARNNATTAMKKEEEKKMEKPTTTTARAALLDTARKEAKTLDEVRANKEKATWKEGMDATESLNNALSALNADMLNEVYNNAMNTSSPIATLCKMSFYPKWYAKTNKKDNVTSLENRDTRLNVLDFIEWAADNETPIKDADKIKTALCDAARKVSDYVLDTLKSEKTISIQTPKKAMNALFALLNVDGIVARSVDMRFIVYATTKARKLGQLAEITDKTIVPYIMDVVTVQTRGIEYKFEEKEEENK